MAGKKRKQQTTQRHLQPLSSDFDTSSVSSSKKRSRPPKLHQQEHKAYTNHQSLLLLLLLCCSHSILPFFFFFLQLISSDLSSKILKEALNQQKEIFEEETQPQTLTSFSSIPANHSIASDSGAESDDDVDAFDGFSETLSHYDAPPVSFFFSICLICLGEVLLCNCLL